MIADVLQQHTVNVDRQDRYTLTNYRIHVSDIIQTSGDRAFCPRERVLGYMSTARPKMQSVTPGMSLIHTMGHAIQDHITVRYIEDGPFGHLIWGDWQCHCNKFSGGRNGLLVKHSLKPPTTIRCDECGGPASHYKEIDLELPDRKIVGHPDILILWRDTLIIYEVKTIERVAVDFTTLEAPLGDHTFQASFYYWIMRRMFEDGLIPFPPRLNLRYLYVDRSTSKIMGGRVFKEFERPASKATRITPRLEKADEVNTAITTRTLPVRMCSSPDVPRAKACKACVECFSRTKSKF